MTIHYDVVVLGAGNAGQAAAGVARTRGASVLVVEAREVGGTCPLRGCVPKKVLVAAGMALEEIERAALHGIEVGPARLDWARLIARERTFVDGVADAMERDLRAKGVDVRKGAARFVGPTTIELGGERIDAGKVIVATGSKPRALSLPGHELLVTSDELLSDPRLPAHVIFVGGGVIAFELGHVMARAGAMVTILEIAPRALPGLEPVVGDRLVALTRDLGIDVRIGVSVEEVRAEGDERVVKIRTSDGVSELRAEQVVNSAGRVADVLDLALDAGGIRHEGARVTVDAYQRSVTNERVFVIGDALSGQPQLSALATAQGKLAGTNATSAEPSAGDWSWMPRVVFTIPAVASVGQTEEELLRQGRVFTKKDSDMRGWRSTRTHAERDAFARVLVDDSSGQLLGAHILGHGAAETIHAFALAMRFRIPAAELREFVYAYPTFHSDVKFLV